MTFALGETDLGSLMIVTFVTFCKKICAKITFVLPLSNFKAFFCFI